jgi:heme/copper-type cytochrome/quinol oxidase subunit 2
MALFTLPAALLLGAAVAHPAAHAAVPAATGDMDRIFHFTDRGLVLGTVFLLALSFMFWVLWSFWRESRRGRTASVHKSLRF